MEKDHGQHVIRELLHGVVFFPRGTRFERERRTL
jgi:hypothetical protein